MREETRQSIKDFDAELINAVELHLYAAVTPEQVNEFYGCSEDCQIATRLRALIREYQDLEAQEPPPT